MCDHSTKHDTFYTQFLTCTIQNYCLTCLAALNFNFEGTPLSIFTGFIPRLLQKLQDSEECSLSINSCTKHSHLCQNLSTRMQHTNRLIFVTNKLCINNATDNKIFSFYITQLPQTHTSCLILVVSLLLSMLLVSISLFPACKIFLGGSRLLISLLSPILAYLPAFLAILLFLNYLLLSLAFSQVEFF